MYGKRNKKKRNNQRSKRIQKMEGRANGGIRKGSTKKFKKETGIYDQLESMVMDKPELGKQVRGWVRKAKEMQESGEVEYWLRRRRQRLEKGKASIASFEEGPAPSRGKETKGTVFPTLALFVQGRAPRTKLN